MSVIRTIVAILLIAVGLAVFLQEQAQGQEPAPPPTVLKVPPPPADPNGFQVSSNVDLVLLDVAVKDENGGFVSNLKKSDFKVFDEKVEQPITAFSAQDVPVTVGLVVDNSGSVRPKKPEIVTAALALVKNSNPKDEVFVVNFNDRVMMGLPEGIAFTADHNLLRKALLSNPAQGRTALYDGIKAALDHLEKGRLGKKTLVLVSDGGDNMSSISRDEIVAMAEKSLATIYTVGIFNPGDKDKNPGFLRELSRITGGESFIPHNTTHLVGICDKIAHDIRNRYAVGFAPAKNGTAGKSRRLKVIATSAEGKKYHVRTRTHYVPAESLTSRSREGAH